MDSTPRLFRYQPKRMDNRGKIEYKTQQNINNQILARSFFQVNRQRRKQD